MKPGIPYLVVTVLLALTAAAMLALRSPEEVSGAGAPSVTLPAAAGDWVGHDVFYCQNEPCMRSFAEDALAGTNRCPACGGALAGISLGEQHDLPAATTIVKKRYVNPAGQTLQVSVVTSGGARRSIHPPQQCLPGQGFVISATRVEAVPLRGHDPLRVMVLDLRRQTGEAASARRGQLVYWFASGDRETPHNLQRLFWLSTDILFRGRKSRWAYVTIFAEGGDSQNYYREQFEITRAFLQQFYPLAYPFGT